jgi:phosphocarrier protein HPr
VKTVEVEVRNKSGLHMRPAADFVRVASRYASTISVQNLTAVRPQQDAKSLGGVLLCVVERGHLVRLTAVGLDEDAAIDELTGLISGRST